MKKILLAFLLLACAAPAWAQFTLSPNGTPYKPVEMPTTRGEKSALTLPFYDDFSNYRGAPDQNIWLSPSGTWVNQTFGYNPISVGVATFDGLRANGSPYKFSTVTVDAVGNCDTLTSKAIDLSALLPADAVYLSFYWQAQGVGEQPDPTDSLFVEFLDNTNKWNYVWGKLGKASNALPTFSAAVIPLNDAKYFHDKFQFRFTSFGRQSGMYDVWNVDYVYMNRNRTATDTLPEEIATSKMRNAFLKRYTAMPLKQYFANPAEETSDSLKATVNNLSSSGFDVLDYKMVLEDARTNTVLADLGTTPSVILPFTAKQYPLVRAIPPNILTPTSQKLVIRGKAIAITGEGTGTIPPIDLRRNDTIYSTNVLSDYLAYDDGSAEYGAGVNQRLGKVAIRFRLHEKDTLTDIRYHPTLFEKDLSAQTFNLVVWQHLNTPPHVRDSVIFKVVLPVRYPTSRSQFLSADSLRKSIEAGFRFPLIPLEAGEFYIGWEQTNTDRILMGYDRNTNSSSEIFFNVGNQWTSWEPEPEQTGSVLFRPIFSKDYVTANEPLSARAPFRLYPNPAQGAVYIAGDLPTYIEIADLQGRVQRRQDLAGKARIELDGLPKGFYLVRATMPNKKIVVQKLVVY